MILHVWATSILAIGISVVLYSWHRLRIRTSSTQKAAQATNPQHIILKKGISEAAHRLQTNILKELPEVVVLPEDENEFESLLNKSWAQQACEVVPSCVVRPRNSGELSRVIKVLKSEFIEREKVNPGLPPSLFAVRCGGHSPVIGASNIEGEVLIDRSSLNEVSPALDGKSVDLGAGCRWVDVYKELDKKGLTVAGGRASPVGYEIVLADGTITTASEKENPELWRALKGGANNFGIVTRFTARSFPTADIWSGFLYLHSSQALGVLSAFHEFLNRVISGQDGNYDEHAAGPIACFTYLQQLRMQVIAVNLTHTKKPENKNSWPLCWKDSGFSKMWRFWSTWSVKSLTAATDETSALNPPGRRQKFATTTIKNDAATLKAVHKAYRDAIPEIQSHNIKKMSWTLVLQPFLPVWARKGDPNIFGLDSCTDEPLVNVSFTVNWARSQDDKIVERITRDAICRMDAYAAKHGTGHRYRYINYCDSWQRPFEGYGKENVELMIQASQKYDPDRLFQRGCVGAFKLDL